MPYTPPTLDAFHPYLTIERAAQRWVLSEAQLAKEGPHPERWDAVTTPFALPAYYFVYPAETPAGYVLVAAEPSYYDYQFLEQIADRSIATVGPLLEWHFQHTPDPKGFLSYLRQVITTDLLGQQGLRDFEATFNWLANSTSRVQETTKEEPTSSAKRELGHRECMLALSLLQVPDQLRGTDTNKKGAFIASLLHFNKRKTEDILRGYHEGNEFDAYAPRVVENLYTYCEQNSLLMTPFGQLISALWRKTQAKRV